MDENGKTQVAFDSDRQYLGSVYAKALLGVTEKSGTTEAVLEEFESLVHDVLDKLPKLDATLESPRVPHVDKERMLDKAFGGKMSPQLLNLLKVVSRHGRMDCLRAIYHSARRQWRALRGRIEVQVRTASPIEPQLTELIGERLRSALNAEVDLQATVDERLLGGLVVRVGDTVYDGSLANQLARMRQSTITRANLVVREALERFTDSASAQES